MNYINYNNKKKNKKMKNNNTNKKKMMMNYNAIIKRNENKLNYNLIKLRLANTYTKPVTKINK